MTVVLTWALVMLPVPLAAQDALDNAMAAELRRASELHIPDSPPPSYVALSATDVEYLERICVMGRSRFRSLRRQLIVTPDVRVGSPDLDNHPVTASAAFVGRSLPYQEDEFAVRHGLWQLLDLAYKSASAAFLRKKALRVTRGKAEYDTDDLSPEDEGRRGRSPDPGPWDEAALERLCLLTSGAFRDAPWLLHAEVSAGLSREMWRLRDTAGMKVDFGRDVAEVELKAVDISTDGMKVSAYERIYAASEDALPDPREVMELARGMISDLAALKVAKTTSPFNAPAILGPEVAAAVIASLGLRLSGEAQRDPNGTRIFQGKVGKRVMPSFLTLVDDPTLVELEGRPLIGSYALDNEGVRGRRVVLIKRGVLKGFLLSRYPVVGFPRSNGHARRPPGYLPVGLPSNLLLSSHRTASEEGLLRLLRRECRRRNKPYGLLVRKLNGYAQQESAGRQDSIRIQPRLVHLVDVRTGELTLVRNLDMVVTPLALMESIVSAGGKTEVVDMLMGVPVSVAVPSLLVREIELQRSSAEPQKLPILPPPEVAAP